MDWRSDYGPPKSVPNSETSWVEYDPVSLSCDNAESAFQALYEAASEDPWSTFWNYESTSPETRTQKLIQPTRPASNAVNSVSDDKSPRYGNAWTRRTTFDYPHSTSQSTMEGEWSKGCDRQLRTSKLPVEQAVSSRTGRVKARATEPMRAPLAPTQVEDTRNQAEVISAARAKHASGESASPHPEAILNEHDYKRNVRVKSQRRQIAEAKMNHEEILPALQRFQQSSRERQRRTHQRRRSRKALLPGAENGITSAPPEQLQKGHKEQEQERKYARRHQEKLSLNRKSASKASTSGQLRTLVSAGAHHAEGQSSSSDRIHRQLLNLGIIKVANGTTQPAVERSDANSHLLCTICGKGPSATKAALSNHIKEWHLGWVHQFAENFIDEDSGLFEVKARNACLICGLLLNKPTPDSIDHISKAHPDWYQKYQPHFISGDGRIDFAGAAIVSNTDATRQFTTVLKGSAGDQRAFRCPTCCRDAVFKHGDYLMRHMRKSHPQSCSDFQKRFGLNYSLH